MMTPKLIAITDTTCVSMEGHLERAQLLCASSQPGTVMLQLRDRQLGIRERLMFAECLFAVAREAGQFFCVNDRMDLALVLGVEAMHLGENSVSVHDVRQLVKGLWISRAVHDLEQMDSAGADAVVLSPIFEPRKGTAPIGLGAIARARARASVPVYALGGVRAGNAASCLTAGASGVAAIGAWLTEQSIEPLLCALGILREAGSVSATA